MRGHPERSNFAIKGDRGNLFGSGGHVVMVTRGAAHPPPFGGAARRSGRTDIGR
jgi:hypothetical protein